MKAEIGENVGSDLVAYISDLQKQVEELKDLLNNACPVWADNTDKYTEWLTRAKQALK